MSATLAHGPAAARAFRLGHEEAVGEAAAVRWQMRRNCSLAPRQLVGVYLSLCGVSTAIAAFFWSHGATLVLPFACLELAAVGAALLCYARHATDAESIVLADGRLSVEQQWGTQVRRVDFQPAWVRVEPEGGRRSLVALSGEGRSVAVGRHLRPELRGELAEEIRRALRLNRLRAAGAA